jgi:hypothetical protein
MKYALTTINTRWEATQRGYGGKTHYTDSQNSDTTAPSGRELYRLQFSLQAASPETFVYRKHEGGMTSSVTMFIPGLMGTHVQMDMTVPHSYFLIK